MDKNLGLNLFYLFILIILTSFFWTDAIKEFTGIILWFFIGLVAIVVVILIYMEFTKDY